MISSSRIAWIALLLASCGSGSGTGGSTSGRDTLVPAPRVLEYIRGDVRTSLVLEVDRVAGMEPRSANSASVESRLETILNKPAGVTVELDGTIPSRGPDHAWTFDELRALSDATFDRVVAGSATKMHVLFLDGHYDSGGEGTVLGIAWDNQRMAIFKDVIEDSCAATSVPILFQDQLCADAELAVWIHEIGHVIGLVDLGLPMVVNHEDADHPGHSGNNQCVMFWAYEGDAVITRIADDLLASGNSALDFDQDCLDDIAAVRDAP